MAGNETDDVLGTPGAECRNNDGYARASDAGGSDDVGTCILIQFGLPLALRFLLLTTPLILAMGLSQCGKRAGEQPIAAGRRAVRMSHRQGEARRWKASARAMGVEDGAG